MKLIKRSISLALAAAFLITGMLGAVPAQETQAAPRLSKSSVTKHDSSCERNNQKNRVAFH